jgi:hypothetical protein
MSFGKAGIFSTESALVSCAPQTLAVLPCGPASQIKARVVAYRIESRYC